MGIFIPDWRGVLMEEKYTTEGLNNLINERIDDLKYVDGINGSKLEVKLLAKESHIRLAKVCEKVDGIAEDIQVLRDFKGFFGFMKKYKLWWVVGLMLGYILTSVGLDVTLANIKNHLPQ